MGWGLEEGLDLQEWRAGFFLGRGGEEYCPLQPCRTMFYISCHDVSPQGIFMQGHIVLNQVKDILMSHKEKFNLNLSFYLFKFQILNFKDKLC